MLLRFVVEAKRAGKILVDTKSRSVSAYKVGGSALKSAADGLQQAQKYCVDTGVLFAALTSGFEWIAYWAVRTDNRPPLEGKAVVFPGLEAIESDFAEFYDLFSRQGLLERLYQVRINEREGLTVRSAENLESVIGPEEVKLMRKPPLVKDLEVVFRGFFSTISSDDDLDMLANCFVESKESREADVSLAKITENLINRIDIVQNQKGAELESHIKAAVELQRGDFVLVIGNKGAGKSTFIDRFFRLVIDKALRERCLLIRVDLSDSDGDIESISSWLTARLVREIESYLFDDGIPRYEELQGIFFSEYQRWRAGEHKFLYERDKGAFKEKFGQFMEDVVNSQPDKYIRRLLRHSVSSRKLMPCLIFDNTDHFRQKFQEQVFQYAQSIHRAVFSFIICPITDRTIWQLSKFGPFQSYDTTAFYLPVPSTKSVLQKRVGYLQSKVSESQGNEGREYFSSKGIRLQINHLAAFAACIDDVFVKTDYVSRTVGWLSNHDIRRSLKISERIILSPIIGIDGLVKMYLSSNSLNVERQRISQALLYGDYNQFNQDNSDFVLNLFSIDPDRISSPLNKLSILRLLMDKEYSGADPDSSYASIEEIQNYFEPMGMPRDRVVAAASNLLDFRLIEPYDPSDTDITEVLRVRVTHSGQMHYEFAVADFVYLTSMASCTAIRSGSVVQEMKELLNRSGKRTRDDWNRLKSMFVAYLLNEDKVFLRQPASNKYDSQRVLREELRSKWVI